MSHHEAPSDLWTIVKLDLTTHRATPWLRFTPGFDKDNKFLDQFLITPDGTTYVYGYHHKQSQLYLVEGLQ